VIKAKREKNARNPVAIGSLYLIGYVGGVRFFQPITELSKAKGFVMISDERIRNNSRFRQSVEILSIRYHLWQLKKSFEPLCPYYYAI